MKFRERYQLALLRGVDPEVIYVKKGGSNSTNSNTNSNSNCKINSNSKKGDPTVKLNATNCSADHYPDDAERYADNIMERFGNSIGYDGQVVLQEMQDLCSGQRPSQHFGEEDLEADDLKEADIEALVNNEMLSFDPEDVDLPQRSRQTKTVAREGSPTDANGEPESPGPQNDDASSKSVLEAPTPICGNMPDRP